MADTIDQNDLKKKQQQGMGVQPDQQQAIAAPRRQIGSPGPKGTGFTNIQKIVGANQGNRLGSTVVGGIKQAGADAQQGIQQAGQQFGQDVNANRLDSDANKQVSQALLDRANRGENLSDEEYAQAQKFREGQYQGPTQLQNASLLAGKAADAEQLGRMGSSEGGRQGLLQRFVGAPQYNQGQQRLDSLLLGANSGAINQARSATQGLADQSARQIQAAQAQAQEAAGGARSFGQKFLQSAGEKEAGVKTAAEQAYGNAQKDEQTRQNTFNAFGDKLKQNTKGTKGLHSIIDVNSNLPPEQAQQMHSIIDRAAALGINPETALMNAMRNVQAQGLSREGVMSQQQVASMNALSKLAGNEGFQNAQAGTFQKGKIAADTSKASSGLGQLKDLPTKGALTAYLKTPNNQASIDATKGLLTAEDNAKINAMPSNSAAKLQDKVRAQRALQQQRAQEALAKLESFEKSGY